MPRRNLRKKMKQKGNKNRNFNAGQSVRFSIPPHAKSMSVKFTFRKYGPPSDPWEPPVVPNEGWPIGEVSVEDDLSDYGAFTDAVIETPLPEGGPLPDGGEGEWDGVWNLDTPEYMTFGEDSILYYEAFEPQAYLTAELESSGYSPVEWDSPWVDQVEVG